MRVWLDPEKMRFYNLTPQDVTAAIQSQNMEVSAGSVGASPAPTDEAFQFTLVSKGNLNTAQEFSDIIIRSGADGLLRLKDVARTDLGSISYSATTFVSGHEAALLGIKRLPGANALSVSKNSRAELERLAQYFPGCEIQYRTRLVRLRNSLNRRCACHLRRDHPHRHDCNPAIPTELACGSHPHDYHSGEPHRHIRRNENNGLYHQHPHALRPGTGNRHCSRRRHCGGGRLLAPCRCRKTLARARLQKKPWRNLHAL